MGGGGGENEKSPSCLIRQNIPCEFWSHTRVSGANSSHKRLAGDGRAQVNYRPNLPAQRRGSGSTGAGHGSAYFQTLLSNHM